MRTWIKIFASRCWLTLELNVLRSANGKSKIAKSARWFSHCRKGSKRQTHNLSYPLRMRPSLLSERRTTASGKIPNQATQTRGSGKPKGKGLEKTCMMHSAFCILHPAFCILLFAFCSSHFAARSSPIKICSSEFPVRKFAFCILHFAFCILHFAFRVGVAFGSGQIPYVGYAPHIPPL